MPHASNHPYSEKPRTTTPRILLYVQLLAAVVSVLAGISESITPFPWAIYLQYVIPVMLPVAVIIPLYLLNWCGRRKPPATTVIIILATSALLTAVTFCGLLPGIQ